jgi:hypothetical protein
MHGMSLSLHVLALLLGLGPDSLRCEARAPRRATPYDSSRAEALAGEYDLVLVATAPGHGRRASGRLELLPTDSVRRRTAAPLSGTGPRVRGLDRPLWGSAALSGDSLFYFPPLARRDPDNPAAVFITDGRLLLLTGPATAGHAELRVTRVTAGGFWGRWQARSYLTIVPVASDVWEGYFCATRRVGSQPPGA